MIFCFEKPYCAVRRHIFHLFVPQKLHILSGSHGLETCIGLYTERCVGDLFYRCKTWLHFFSVLMFLSVGPAVFFQVYVLKRPHVDEFLKRMGELFECVLFTASLAKVSQ